MKKSRIPYTHTRDGRLVVRVPYRAADGKWKSKTVTVTGADEALRVIQQLREELGRLGPEAFDGDKMTFDKLLHQHKLANPDKPRWYLDPIAAHFGSRLIRTITYGDIRQFRISREKVKNAHNGADRKPATINREVEHLRAMIFYAVRHGWLRHNPFTAGPPLILRRLEDHRTRVPTPAEEASILATCDGPRAHLRPLIVATRDTGLRKSALQSLTWSMVDWEARVLRVPDANNAFKRRPKVVGLSVRLYALLREMRDQSERNPDAKIFGDVKDFKRGYATACRMAGVEGLRFNDFRHGFATDLMEAGVPERMAMKVAGHTCAETHAIYANVDQRIARQVANALDQLHASRLPISIADLPTASPLVN